MFSYTLQILFLSISALLSIHVVKVTRIFFLISDQARLENVLSRMKDNMDGRITAVCVLDNPYFSDPFIKSVKPENLIEYATPLSSRPSFD